MACCELNALNKQSRPSAFVVDFGRMKKIEFVQKKGILVCCSILKRDDGAARNAEQLIDTSKRQKRDDDGAARKQYFL